MAARGLEALRSFLSERLKPIPGVANLRTTICVEDIKPPSPWPVAAG